MKTLGYICNHKSFNMYQIQFYTESELKAVVWAIVRAQLKFHMTKPVEFICREIERKCDALTDSTDEVKILDLTENEVLVLGYWLQKFENQNSFIATLQGRLEECTQASAELHAA